MKILTDITESAGIPSLTTLANKLIDIKFPQDLSTLYQFLSPQWLAGYMGLKKLIEKDYQDEEEPTLVDFTNA